MKNLILFTFLIFIITGLLTPSIFSNSFASPEDAPGRDQGTKTSNGCDKSNNQNQAKNNPNCDDTTSSNDDDNDGLTNEEEVLLGTNPNNPDTDSDTLLDGNDACPLETNFNHVNGEPDHDNDGTIDKRDKSPCTV